MGRRKKVTRRGEGRHRAGGGKGKRERAMMDVGHDFRGLGQGGEEGTRQEEEETKRGRTKR